MNLADRISSIISNREHCFVNRDGEKICISGSISSVPDDNCATAAIRGKAFTVCLRKVVTAD